jgi:hypothetical protein
MTRTKTLSFLTAAAAGALLAACAVGPKAPEAALPTSGTGGFVGAANPAVTAAAPARDDWWRLYDDPALDRLVEASLAANADLRVAYANLDGARAALRQARAARLPQTTIESAGTIDNSATQPSASSNVPTTDYDLALTASWDIDLFGRLRSGALAAGADADAQAAALDSLRVAVVVVHAPSAGSSVAGRSRAACKCAVLWRHAACGAILHPPQSFCAPLSSILSLACPCAGAVGSLPPPLTVSVGIRVGV